MSRICQYMLPKLGSDKVYLELHDIQNYATTFMMSSIIEIISSHIYMYRFVVTEKFAHEE